jgi:SWIM/SEC-C metal-binding protein
MAKLGTKKKPVRFRVQSMERLEEIALVCHNNGWTFVGGIEPDKPEDISEVEYLINPTKFKFVPRMGSVEYRTVVNEFPPIGRNDPCPCGSGKKYKKCCG